MTRCTPASPLYAIPERRMQWREIDPATWPEEIRDAWEEAADG